MKRQDEVYPCCSGSDDTTEEPRSFQRVDNVFRPGYRYPEPENIDSGKVDDGLASKEPMRKRHEEIGGRPSSVEYPE